MDAYEQLRSSWDAITANVKPAVATRLSGAVESARRAAALTFWFNPVDLWRSIAGGSTPETDWLERLRGDCAVDGADVTQWVMLDRERLPLLARLSAERGLLAAAEAAARRTDDETPRLMSALLRNTFEPAATDSRALAAAAEIARWLAAIDPALELPDAAEMAGLVEMRTRDAELAQLTHQIVGRESERRLLLQFARNAWRGGSSKALPLFRLEGVGGIGKSTLAADFALGGMRRAADDAILIWIDYDKLRIRPEDTRTVLLEVTRQLAWALPQYADALRLARAEIRGKDRVAADRTEARDALDTLASALDLSSSRRLERPVLLVLDTFEQVERAPTQTADILGILDAMRTRLFSRIAVLACGRAVFSRGFGDVAVQDLTQPLHGLSREASLHLLTGRGGLGDRAAARLLSAFDDVPEAEFRDRIGIPMLLNLSARLVREGDIDLDAADIREIRSKADVAMTTAYLYGRVLSRVPSELRPLANPGLVVPEVSADVIRHVIWPAVHGGASTIGPDRAQALFERLRDETWLVEPVPGAVPPRVRHRPDLRRAMLERMRSDTRGDAQATLGRLHRTARDWHRSARQRHPPGSEERRFHSAGEAYHGLQLSALTGQSTGLGILQIRSARDDLAFVVDDFPTEYRPVVRALLGEAIGPEQLELLDLKLRISVVTDLFRAYASRGDHQGAVRFAHALSPADRERTPRIARSVAYSFVASGRWTTDVDLAEPLLLGPHPRAMEFGPGVPPLRPFLACYAVGGEAAALHAIERVAVTPYLPEGTLGRLELFASLFRSVLDRKHGSGSDFLAMASASIGSLPATRPSEDLLPLLRAYGALLQRKDPGRRNADGILAAARRGAFTSGLITLAEVEGRKRRDRTSAQWCAACRVLDRRLQKEAALAMDLPLEPMFEEFHLPLAEALAASLEPQTAYRLAAHVWEALDIKPADLRPPVFADSCADPRARHERARTLVTFLARVGRLHGVLEWIGSTRLEANNADLPKVVELAMRWRSAFSG